MLSIPHWQIFNRFTGYIELGIGTCGSRLATLWASSTGNTCSGCALACVYLGQALMMMLPSLTLTQRLSASAGYYSHYIASPFRTPFLLTARLTLSTLSLTVATVWKLSKLNWCRPNASLAYSVSCGLDLVQLFSLLLIMIILITMTVRPNEELWLELWYLNFTTVTWES